MPYTIVTRPQVVPKYVDRNGESRLNPIPAIDKPPSFIAPVYSPLTLNPHLIYEQDVEELWEDSLGTATEAEYLPLLTAHRESYLPALWAAADAYEKEYISGMAIGLLTIGVLMGKPIAGAISAWSGAHWSSYYTRKAAIMAGEIPNFDFTSSGPMPYSVPELRAELGI